MLAHPQRLAEATREVPLPVVLYCPDCSAMYVRYEWELLLSAHTLLVRCLCSHVFNAPRELMNPDAEPGELAYYDLRPLPWGSLA